MRKKARALLCILCIIVSAVFAGCVNEGDGGAPEVEPAPDEQAEKDRLAFYADWEIERGWYPQAECDILTTGFETYEHIPSEFRMAVSIPKVKESLPNADGINQKIDADYEKVITSSKADYNSLVTGYSYPTLMIYYKEFEFDGVYELCVFERRYSNYGSGIDFSVNRYYYDANIKDEISEDEFLLKLGYRKDDIIKAFYDYAREIDEEASEETYGYSYEKITYWYHVDENGALEFNTGLWS